MTTYNRDIHPTEETLKLYPGLDFLAANKPVQLAFDQAETRANGQKRVYHYCGLWSVVLTAISALYSVAYAVFGFSGTVKISGAADDFTRYTSAFFLACAAGALLLHGFSYFARPKSAWLQARYAAERLRSIKFQAFFLVASSEDAAVLQRRVEVFSNENLELLRAEVNNMGLAALDTFVPKDHLNAAETPSKPANTHLYKLAQRAYRQLRLEHQEGFAREQVRSVGDRQSVWQAVADFLFIFGAVLVALGLLNIVWPSPFLLEPIRVWLEFLTVAVFVASAALFIMNNASTGKSSSQRYTEYADALKSLRVASDAGELDLNGEIEQTELLALGELRSFCDQAQLISYRL